MRTKFFIAAASACVMLALAPITHAQNFPNKPVRLVDPYAPGGSTSVVSQSLSKKFQELFKNRKHGADLVLNSVSEIEMYLENV